MTEIKLSEPIEAHGEKIDTLKIREPRGKDFKKIPGKSMDMPFAMILEFAAVLADIPPSAFDNLCSADVQKVLEVVGPFLAGSQTIGKA